MNDDVKTFVDLCNGDVRAWIEQEAIHLKAIDRHGDPVELSVREVETLVSRLKDLADQIRSLE